MAGRACVRREGLREEEHAHHASTSSISGRKPVEGDPQESGVSHFLIELRSSEEGVVLGGLTLERAHRGSELTGYLGELLTAFAMKLTIGQQHSKLPSSVQADDKFMFIIILSVTN